MIDIEGILKRAKILFSVYLAVLIFLPGRPAIAQDPVQVSETENKIQDAFLAARLEITAGHYDKGLKKLDSLSRAYRHRSTIYYEMAQVYIEQKRYTEALEKLDRAIALEKDNIWYLERLAFVQTELRRIQDAANTYKRLIDLNPKSSRYYDITADLLLTANRHPEAMNILQNKEAQLGFSEYNSLKIIDIALDIKRFDDAALEAEKLLARKNPPLRDLKKAAEVYRLKGDTEKVSAVNAKILAIDPNDVEAMLDKMEKENGKVNESAFLVSLQPLIQNPSIPAAGKLKELMPFVENHAVHPNVPYAETLLHVCELLANAHPDDARVHAMYGDVLMNSHREVEAVRQYERTIALQKNNFMVWEQMMYGLEYLEDYTRLNEAAMEAMDYFPNQAISYYFAAVASFSKNDLVKAKEWLSEAELISGKNPVILARVRLLQSKIASSEKNTDKAMQLVEESIQTSSGLMGAAFEWKGDLLMEGGKREDARTSYLKAFELLPDSKTLPAKIDKCQ